MYLDRYVGIQDGLCAGVNYYFHVLALLHEVHSIHLLGGNVDLLEGLVVHENQIVAILVKVLVWATLNAYVLQLLADVETLFDYTAVNHVLQRNVHDSVALAWLAMQEVDAEIELAVHADACALLDVL